MSPQKDVSGRWMLAWRALAALTFIVVGAAVLSQPAGWASAPRFWLLFGAMVVWYGLSVPIGRSRLHDSLVLSLLYFAIGWAIWAELLRLHTASFAFAAFLFPLTYSYLPWRRAIGFALVLTALMFVRGTAWQVRLDAAEVLGGSLGVLSTVMLSLFIHSIIKQSKERQRLILELEQAKAGQSQAEREAGVLQERQRLAQQIHDSVAQGFVGIVTHLEAAETSLDAANPASRHISAAKQSARESLAEARALVTGLRPDLVPGEPLPRLLERHLSEWSARHGIAAQQVVTGNPRELGSSREEILLQAAREGLNNTRAHARAHHVTLTLSYMDDEVVLDLQDDGQGVGSSVNSEGGGFGLRALEERVRGVGGRCELESRAGEGATLTVTLRLDA